MGAQDEIKCESGYQIEQPPPALEEIHPLALGDQWLYYEDVTQYDGWHGDTPDKLLRTQCSIICIHFINNILSYYNIWAQH